jgi:hypothetical protein
MLQVRFLQVKSMINIFITHILKVTFLQVKTLQVTFSQEKCFKVAFLQVPF